ncbi:MAG: NAD(P)-dependent glycerol-3-phosphate dehydrogenase [Magnetococcales bacterium]|nr:NAD(P)-dependent glycerol-3-phosphate dehydrogenase [Magnetococcales bacterium]NGZ27491.1 NAD(P)-dependent glycerol-3-phosphate dehydrogenase [Magnetococcales bacterium]
MLPALPRVTVVGAGSWGTALAHVLAEKLPQVTLWCREEEVAAGIREQRRNPLFLPDLPVSPHIIPETDLVQAVQGADLLVMVVPTQFTRTMVKDLAPHISPNTCFVSASKGVEIDSMTLLSHIYQEVLGDDRRVCFLSGPSFAREVLEGRPTAVAIAGVDPQLVAAVQSLFHTRYFRTYASDDVVGVELGGALKNVIALAAGISDGLAYGFNARAALITRGLVEMIRLGVVLGARKETFAGLSGLGDLLLTATSDLSRNRSLGVRLGRGETLQQILGSSREVAEGVKTVVAVQQLAAKHAIDMPITNGVYEILYNHRNPRTVVTQLMERTLKSEVE